VTVQLDIALCIPQACILHTKVPQGTTTVAKGHTTFPSGTPLETSKCRAMKPVLYTQLLNWVGQLGVVSESP